MRVSKLQEEIDNMNYWDCRVLDFTISYFGDEITVVLENDNQTDFIVKFLKCYKVEYETDAKDRWRDMEVKSMNREQLGYFAHEISIKESSDNEFIKISLILPMLFAKIICKNISIIKANHSNDNFFWSKN